jgi:hypothetical protein
MEWMKIREDLPEDPVTLFIADVVGIHPDEVVGKLVRIWRWSRHHTASGFVPGVKPGVVDTMVGRRGFAQAMASAPDGPWLVIEPRGLTFPKWDEHNSKAAKSRALARERVQTMRSKRNTRNAGVTPESRSERNALDETRRDEMKEGPSLRSGLAPPAGDAPAAHPTKKRPPKSAQDVIRVPDGRAATSAFTDGWDALFRLHKGAGYGFDGPKDMQSAKAILGFAGLRVRPVPSTADEADAAVAVALDMAERLLTSTDPFFVGKGVDLGLLRSQWNRISSAGVGAIAQAPGQRQTNVERSLSALESFKARVTQQEPRRG